MRKRSHHTAEAIKKIKIAKKNQKNIPWPKGSHHTKEFIEKNRQAQPYLGKHLPVKQREKMRQTSIKNKDKLEVTQFKKGHKTWNKGLKGIHFSTETEFKKGQEAWNKGKEMIVFHKDISGEKYGRWTVLSKSNKKSGQGTLYWLCICECGIKKEVLGTSLRNGMSQSCGCLHKEMLRLISPYPFYNQKACEYFKQFDEINNTFGQYATSGGELRVLGYWLDYINHDKKLIIEWDEKHHYINDKLKEKDIERQKEIENHFPDYTFIRIRESKYIPEVLHLLRDAGA